MDEIDPEFNPFTPVYDRGYVTNNPGYWAANLPKLQETSAQCGGTDLDISTFIGWGLIYTYQLTAAKELLHSVIEKAPETVGADWGYFKALEEMNQEPEAIEFGRENWVGKKNHGFCLLVSQILLEINNVEQAKALENEWLFLTAQGDGVAWELRGQIAEAREDWGDASSCFALLMNSGVLFPKIQLHFFRSLIKANSDAGIAGIEAACSQILKNPIQEKIWLRYQMCRWGRCSNVKELFAGEPGQNHVLLGPDVAQDSQDLHSELLQFASLENGLSVSLLSRTDLIERVKSHRLGPDRHRPQKEPGCKSQNPWINHGWNVLSVISGQ